MGTAIVKKYTFPLPPEVHLLRKGHQVSFEEITDWLKNMRVTIECRHSEKESLFRVVLAFVCSLFNIHQQRVIRFKFHLITKHPETHKLLRFDIFPYSYNNSAEWIWNFDFTSLFRHIAANS